MKRGIAVAVFLILSLSDCTLGPDYRRPDVESPASWRFEEKETKEVTDSAWWEQLGDPALNELIEIALTENKDVKIAAARIEEFTGQYVVTRSQLFPRIEASASVERQRESGRGVISLPPTVKNPNDIYDASFLANWEIDLWGKLRRATEAARADLLSTVEARRAVILSLVASVNAAYVNLSGLDRQLEITQATVGRRKESYRIFSRQYEKGLVSKLELYQAKSQYEQALAAVPLIEKAIGQQEDAICLLLGRNPGPIKRGKTLEQFAVPAIPAGLPSSLLERRPDIRQAEQNLIAANARIGVARAQFFPSISLTGLFGWESTDLSKLFTGPARTWHYAVPVTQTIFAGGALIGQLKAAEAVQKEALFQYQAAIQKAFADVEDALIDQRRTREQLEALALQVEDLREYARIARLRYDNGYVSYLDVLDAERSLFAAELSYTQTQAALFQALINLYKAMGGGWIDTVERKSVKGDGKPGA